MSAPRLLIGTPTANGVVTTDYVAALMALTARLNGRDIPIRYKCIDGPDGAVQRDMLARELQASDCTHLLMLDGDMAFSADLAEQLLDAAKPVVGVIYRRRPVDFGRLKTSLTGRSLRDARAAAQEWVVSFLGDTLNVGGGLCQVEALGTGCLLVERGCLDEMDARGVAPVYREGGIPLRAFFRDMHSGGAALDSDFTFCRRWRKAGGEVWAYVPAEVRHVGETEYGMPFTAYLKALGTASRPALSGAVASPPARS